MLINTLNTLFGRDLQRLHTEISAYQTEERIWDIAPNVSNAAGNLCLHIVGNLRLYIGATLGGDAYIRHREQEFTLKNIPRSQLLAQIDTTATIVRQTLNQLQAEQLAQVYPIKVFAEEMTTSHFLVHLTTHLAYHLGQINYHRRLLDTPPSIICDKPFLLIKNLYSFL